MIPDLDIYRSAHALRPSLKRVVANLLVKADLGACMSAVRGSAESREQAVIVTQRSKCAAISSRVKMIVSLTSFRSNSSHSACVALART